MMMMHLYANINANIHFKIYLKQLSVAVILISINIFVTLCKNMYFAKIM